MSNIIRGGRMATCELGLWSFPAALQGGRPASGNGEGPGAKTVGSLSEGPRGRSIRMSRPVVPLVAILLLVLAGMAPALAQLNHEPNADAGPNQTVEQTSSAGANVTLDGSGSYDIDQGQTLTYEWDLDGDDDFDDAVGVNPTVLLALGSYTVTLRVTDNGTPPLSSTDDVLIVVRDTTRPTFVGVEDVTVEQLELGGTRGADIDLGTISATDICDTDPDIEVWVVGTPWVPYDPNILFALGTNTIARRAVDFSGNPWACTED